MITERVNDQPRQQWKEQIRNRFTIKDRSETTILLSGLTMNHDSLLCSAFRAGGYRMHMMDVPDNEALQRGKEFGNRGQCNPTYYTVGNLVKYLLHLKNDVGLSTEEIIDKYVMITAGACGPCRFGMYVTEYRKALRDSGFDGFRVLVISQSGSVKSASGGGFHLPKSLLLTAFSSVVIADILNVVGYRLRPYEVEAGQTNRALEKCREHLGKAIENRSSLARAALRCRKELAKVRVDRSQVKPKVGVIGEFWANVTEGDGNYKLYEFLESEGAEVDVQIVTNWLLFLLWEVRWDTRQRMKLKKDDHGERKSLAGVNPYKRIAINWAVDKALKTTFRFYSALIGLKDYKVMNAEAIAKASHEHYDNHLRGGEGHMEVGKVIENAKKKKVNMTISVKPFGCMPSSGVSDGVQSLISEKYPHLFLAIETTGDAAVNVYSRVQMFLFKAKEQAKKDMEAKLENASLKEEDFKNKAREGKFQNPFMRVKGPSPCTAVNFAQHMVN